MSPTIPLKSLFAGAFLASALLASQTCFADSSADWRGPYLGINGGGVFANYHNSSGVAGPSGENGNYIYGGQAGYNFQIAGLVLGAEADGSAMNLQSKQSGVDFREDWMSTVRGRIGYSFNRFLPFATAGIGFTDAEAKIPGSGSEHKVGEGLAAGGGLDIQMAEHWIARVEYLYVELPKENFNVSGTEVRGGSADNIARAAFSYRFE